jgi:hypothetical protein
MTDPTGRAPAGWYPAAEGSTQLRWWDGTQWTDHVHDPATAYSLDNRQQQHRAPEGTSPYTVWMWILAFVPLLALASPSVWNVHEYLRETLVTSTSDPLAMYSSPTYLSSLAVSGGVYLVSLILSIGDYRTLRRAGVPRPFHWAWSFLASPVYVIGRGVVVRRRTGRGLAPMWVFIAAEVIGTIVTISIVFSALIPEISNYSVGG